MKKRLPESTGLSDLRDRLRLFAAERDWEQFHSPKNLASALIVEAVNFLRSFNGSARKIQGDSPPTEKRKPEKNLRTSCSIWFGWQTNWTSTLSKLRA